MKIVFKEGEQQTDFVVMETSDKEIEDFAPSYRVGDFAATCWRYTPALLLLRGRSLPGQSRRGIKRRGTSFRAWPSIGCI
jgi:hypothetical protein